MAFNLVSVCKIRGSNSEAATNDRKSSTKNDQTILTFLPKSETFVQKKKTSQL